MHDVLRVYFTPLSCHFNNENCKIPRLCFKVKRERVKTKIQINESISKINKTFEIRAALCTDMEKGASMQALLGDKSCKDC